MTEEYRPKNEAILIRDQLYTPLQFKKEQELEDLASSLSNFVYGTDTIYFDLEERVKSSDRKFNATDGLLFDLPKKP